MKFFAIHLQDLESEAFASATESQIVTWLFLHAYCSKQMNGGVIDGAANMLPRFWMRHGIERVELLKDESPLWDWLDDGSLKIAPYDVEGEALTRKQVEAGRATAQKRWGKDRSPINSPTEPPNSSPDAPNHTLPNHTLPNHTLPNHTLPNLTQSDQTLPLPSRDEPSATEPSEESAPLSKAASAGVGGILTPFFEGGGGMDGGGSQTLEIWKMLKITDHFTDHEIVLAYEAAKRQHFKDRRGQPIASVKAFVTAYVQKVRSNGGRDTPPERFSWEKPVRKLNAERDSDPVDIP